MNIDPNVNDCDFIDVHASNVDSWHVRHLSDTEYPTAATAVSARYSASSRMMQLGRVAVA